MSRPAQVGSAFPHTAVSRISILRCLSSLPSESSWVEWVQTLEIQEKYKLVGKTERMDERKRV